MKLDRRHANARGDARLRRDGLLSVDEQVDARGNADRGYGEGDARRAVRSLHVKSEFQAKTTISRRITLPRIGGNIRLILSRVHPRFSRAPR